MLTYIIWTGDQTSGLRRVGQESSLVLINHGNVSEAQRNEIQAELCRDLAAEMLMQAHNYDHAAGLTARDFDAEALDWELDHLRNRMHERHQGV